MMANFKTNASGPSFFGRTINWQPLNQLLAAKPIIFSKIFVLVEKVWICKQIISSYEIHNLIVSMCTGAATDVSSSHVAGSLKETYSSSSRWIIEHFKYYVAEFVCKGGRGYLAGILIFFIF